VLLTNIYRTQYILKYFVMYFNTLQNLCHTTCWERKYIKLPYAPGNNNIMAKYLIRKFWKKNDLVYQLLKCCGINLTPKILWCQHGKLTTKSCK